jgi:hypothetical protein
MSDVMEDPYVGVVAGQHRRPHARADVRAPRQHRIGDPVGSGRVEWQLGALWMSNPSSPTPKVFLT